MRPDSKINIFDLFKTLFLGTIYIQMTFTHALMSTTTPSFVDSKSSVKSKTIFSVTGLHVGLFTVHFPGFENFHKIYLS